MKKKLNVLIKLLFLIIVLIIISIGGGGLYLKSNLLDFENNYSINQFEISEISINGYKFLDRNGNKQLDVYEDDRQSIEFRANDLLLKLTKE